MYKTPAPDSPSHFYQLPQLSSYFRGKMNLGSDTNYSKPATSDRAKHTHTLDFLSLSLYKKTLFSSNISASLCFLVCFLP